MLHLVYNYVIVVLQVSLFCDDSGSVCDKTAGNTNNFIFDHIKKPLTCFSSKSQLNVATSTHMILLFKMCIKD